MPLKLGLKARDRITGFTGTLTSRTEFLNGCVRYTITPPLDKDGKFVDDRWFDEQQIELLEVVEEATEKVERRATGGPASSSPPSFGTAPKI
jgi:hypothetical protein